MGYIRHDAIIATSFDLRYLHMARDKAQELGLQAFGPFASEVNNYVSFFIPPDGSKEGWPDSDEADKKRMAWKTWIRDRPDVFVDWAHVNFGGDEPESAKLIAHNMPTIE